MESLLTGKVFWSYDFEVLQRSPARDMLAHLSGVPPFHTHEGEITLTNEALFIIGDIDLYVSLNELDQIFLGFDEIFPRALVKNFGIFWEPFRLEFTKGDSRGRIYLIIDYNMFGGKNKVWFDTMKDMMSV